MEDISPMIYQNRVCHLPITAMSLVVHHTRGDHPSIVCIKVETFDLPEKVWSPNQPTPFGVSNPNL